MLKIEIHHIQNHPLKYIYIYIYTHINQSFILLLQTRPFYFYFFFFFFFETKLKSFIHKNEPEYTQKKQSRSYRKTEQSKKEQQT